MKTRMYDSSYDRMQAVDLAHQLSRRFQKSRGALDALYCREPEEQPALSSNRAEAPPQVAAPTVNFDDSDVYRDEVWRTLLAWAISSSQSRWAYVSDERGLIISEEGDRGNLNTEETASHIANAVDSLMHGSSGASMPRIVTLKTNAGWLTSLSCPFGGQALEKSYLMVGLLGASAPRIDISEKIHAVFCEKISAF